VVIRVDDVGELRVLHVVDFLGAGADVPAVLAFLEEFSRERGVALAGFYCSADPIGHPFWSHGWFSSVDDFHTQVPNWFYPIDMRIPPTTSLIFWDRDDVGALLDRSRLYITKGDCDMDRPTMTTSSPKGFRSDSGWTGGRSPGFSASRRGRGRAACPAARCPRRRLRGARRAAPARARPVGETRYSNGAIACACA
jgi:hypothetical protein